MSRGQVIYLTTLIEFSLLWISPCTSKINFRKWTPQWNPVLPLPQTIWAIFLIKWLHHHNISTTCLVIAVNILHLFVSHGPLDLNCFNSFLNCFVDLKNILNNLIPWDLTYIQGCTTPVTTLRHPEDTLIRCLYITAMNTSSIESNNPHIQQNQCIQVNHLAKVPQHAFWQWHQWKKVYSHLNCADRDIMSGFDDKKMLTMVASIVQEPSAKWILVSGSLQESLRECGV
jgi:hypothetical protein